MARRQTKPTSTGKENTGQKVKLDNPATRVIKLLESPRHISMTSTVRQNASAMAVLSEKKQ